MTDGTNLNVRAVRERLDQDEAAALAASAGGRWGYSAGDSVGAWTLYDDHWNIATLTTYRHNGYDYATRMPAFRDPHYVDADANGAHIARHDPGRALADVAALRAVLTIWEREDAGRHRDAESEARAWLMDEVVAALAGQGDR